MSLGLKMTFSAAQTKEIRVSGTKHLNNAAAVAAPPPPPPSLLTSCRTEADQQQVLCRTQLVAHGGNDFPDGGGHGDADGGVGVVAAVDFEQD